MLGAVYTLSLNSERINKKMKRYVIEIDNHTEEVVMIVEHLRY
jgi:hypothetical protein